MSDTETVTMRATFYGGPADGGELLLVEPLRQTLEFPMTATLAAIVLARPQPKEGGAEWLNTTPAGTYRLHMTDDQRVIRDPRGRVIYAYLCVPRPAPNPTEGETHD